MDFMHLALLACGLAAGCAAPPRAIDDPHPLEAKAGIVFLVHGIWPDGGWVPEAERAFRKAGLETVPVHYDCFVVGYQLGSGTDAPADRIAALARALEARHAATGCAAPLRFHAIAFSGGTVVTLKAAWRGARFETVHLGGCSIPAFSPVLADAVRAGRIGSVKNYWSLFDGVTGWGWGAGQFAYHGGGPEDGVAIENIPLAYHHLDPPFDEDFVARIARDLAVAARDAPPHTCFRQPGFARWWRRQTDRLAAGEGVDGGDSKTGAGSLAAGLAR